MSAARMRLVVGGPPVADLVRRTLLASLIRVAGNRTQALLLVGADPVLRSTIAVTVSGRDEG